MTTPIAPPVSGRWAWRDYLPNSTDEWLALRNRVIELRPAGVDVLRFSDWVLAEMRDAGPTINSPRVGAKYRKLLYELAQTPPPKKRRGRGRSDAGATELGATLKLAVAAASGAAVALATGNAGVGGVAAAAVLTAPRIPDGDVMSSCELPAAA